MRFLTRWTILICCALVFTISRPHESPAIEDAIIAVVNDELITLKDLKDYIHSTYVSLVAEGLEDSQIKAYMKDMEANGTNKLIEDKLILSKANAIGIKVREALVDERIEDMELKYGSEQKLVDALIKNGATLTDLRRKILDQLKIQFIIDHEVKSGIYVNPQEVTHYYEHHKEQFKEGDRVTLESIFIAYGNDKMEALRKAVEVSKETAMKKNFHDIMAKYSQAPSVGTVNRGQLRPLIEDIVFHLKLNKISPLVAVDSGIYVFKLVGQRPARISSLDDVKDSIYDLLYKKKFKTQFLRWLENLKKEAYIEIKQ